MNSLHHHWNALFASKADNELGWYERDVAQTLRFLEPIPDIGSKTIFLPGAGTSLLVDDLLAKGARLVLNDISDQALERLRRRVGEHERLIWLHHDIAQPLPRHFQADIWLDRAVLHFLLAEERIAGYFANLQAVLKPAGYVLLAEFAPDGAPKCAGLEVHRYGAEEMADRLGSEFTLIKTEHYPYINPAGDVRPYTYALFQRRSRYP
jgi:EEF1A lysine methyltransferase 2